MTHKQICVLIMICSFSGFIEAHHKIVYLIATPRSLSTVFLRAMHARGDMSIFNEPSVPVWYKNAVPDIKAEEWYRPGIPTSYQEIIDQLFAEAQQRPVFIKEHSFMVQDLLNHDNRILHDADITFAILLRDPHHAIISYYKKEGGITEEFSETIGYKGCYALYELIKKETGKAPVIVITEQLYTYPDEMMRKFCEDVGIPFLPGALQWPSLGAAFDGVEEWHEMKLFDKTHYWHGDAIMSTGFQKPRSYEVDEDGNPTFSEISNLDDREQCKEAYRENMYYYNLCRIGSSR